MTIRAGSVPARVASGETQDWPVAGSVGDDGAVCRLLATLVLATVVAVASLAGSPAVAAQSDEPVSTTAPEPGGDIIPKPNSGVEPNDAGDRGGALQTVLFIGIVGGIVVIGLLVARQSRKARAERGF